MIRRVAVLLLLLAACGKQSSDSSSGSGSSVSDEYSTPEKAVTTALNATKTGDADKMVASVVSTEREEAKKKNSKDKMKPQTDVTFTVGKATINGDHAAVPVNIKMMSKDIKDDKGIDMTITAIKEADGWRVSLKGGDETAKKKEEGHGEVVEMMSKFTDQVCACKDMACAKEVQNQFAKEGEKFANTKPTDEEMKAVMPMMERMSKCMQALTSAAPPTEPAAPSAPSASTELEKTGVPECDDFMGKYMKCIQEKLPEAARASAVDGLKQAASAWKSAATSPEAKAALIDSCKQMATATKEATKSLGCEF